MGWSALSPLGNGRQAFAKAIQDNRTCQLPENADGTPIVGYTIEGHDAAAFIGARGSRTIDRMTAMVIAATNEILSEIAELEQAPRADIGLVLGTSTGSIDSITKFLRDTFVQAKPYFVNPADFPNTVMNGAAGRTAIWHGLRGLNSTIAGGHVTGLAALRYATRMMRRGYAQTLLVGAVEELSAPIAWAASRIRRPAGDGTPLTPLGEGSAMFLLDSPAIVSQRGVRPLAELVDFRFVTVDPKAGPQEQAERLTAIIQATLGAAGIAPDELWAVSLAHSGDGALDQIETAGLAQALGRASPRRVMVSNHVGNTFSALGAFQVAALLALAETEAVAALSRPALCTSVGVDGATCCALLRL